MKLIIAEKEQVANSISKYLETLGEVTTRKKGYIQSQNYYIVWTYGHLLKNKFPEEYDPRLKDWKYEDLPLKFEWELSIIEGKEYLFNIISDIIKKPEVQSIIHAGDPDAEGQLIIDELLNFINNKKPVERVLINDTTLNGIKIAFSKIEDNKNYINLGKSAYARSIGDYLTGINLTRLATLINLENEIDLIRFGSGTLTIGRVQTPTLNLVYTRDLEIENHIKKKIFELFSSLEIQRKSNPKEREEMLLQKELYQQNFHDKELGEKYCSQMIKLFNELQNNYTCKLKYHLPNEQKELDPQFIKTHLEDTINLLKSQNEFKVVVKKELSKEPAPLPFNLLKLQQYCSKKFDYTPDKVMEITQNLRDNYNCITYNRSDCQYLTSVQFSEAPETIKQILKNLDLYVPEISTQIVSKAFDDSKISAHTAIIPTNIELDLSLLSEKEKNVYKAISDYYLIQFMPKALKEKTTVSLSFFTENDFSSSSSKYIELGYRAYLRDKLEDEDEEKSDIHKLLAGTYSAKYIESNIIEKETTPPKRYTYETLLGDMNSISKYVADPKIREILKAKDKDIEGANGSIGTPATVSTILKNLFERKYIEKKDKTIRTTDIGREFLKTLPDELKKPDMTALWWTYQEEIKKGADPNVLIDNVYEAVKKIVDNKEIVPLPDKFKKSVEKESFGNCPICNSPIYKGKTKSGLINYYCSNYKNGCTFTMWEQMKYFDNIIKITDTRAKTLLNNKDITVKLTAKSGKEYSGKLKLKINKVGDKIFVNFEPIK